MIVQTKTELATLTKDDLWYVAIDRNNTQEIQEAALQRWMSIDDADYEDSIRKMRMMIDDARRQLRGLDYFDDTQPRRRAV